MWEWLRFRGSSWTIRILAGLSVVAVLVMVGIVVLSPGKPGDVGAALVQESVSDTGYNGRIVLTNSGSDLLDGWEVELKLPSSSKIVKHWDASMDGSGQSYRFSNLDENKRIEPGGNASFGFTVEGTGKPVSCRLNGDPCVPPKDSAPPTAPANLRVTGVTVSTVNLEWDAATDNLAVVAYRIYTGAAENADMVAGSPQTDTSVSGLTPATPYTFRVSAVDTAGNESALGSAVTIRTADGDDAEKPTVPTGLRQVGKTATSVQLSWNASEDNKSVTEYRIYAGTDAVAVSSSLSAQVTGLTAGNAYQFTVTAVDEAENESARSSAISVTTDTTDSGPPPSPVAPSSPGPGDKPSQTPAAGTLLSKGKTATASSSGTLTDNANAFLPAQALDGNSETRWASLKVDPSWLRVDLGKPARLSRVKLLWDLSCATKYTIEASTDAVVWKSIYSTDKGDGQIDEIGVGGVGRYVQVVGKTRCRPTGGYSLQEFEVYGSFDGGSGNDKFAPTPPSGLKPGEVTGSTIGLSWTAAKDDVAVTGYDIYHDGNLLRSVDGETTSVTLNELPPNTRYRLTVLARDADGNASQASNMVEVTTSGDGDATPPSGDFPLRTTSVTANSVTLKWDAVTDAGGKVLYDVYVGGGKVGTIKGTCVILTGLAANTEYTFHIKARDEAGNNSPASSPITVRTKGNGDEPPTTPGKATPEPAKNKPAGGTRIGKVTTITTDLRIPWGITFLPSGDALVAERDTFSIVRVTPKGDKIRVGKVPGVQDTGGEGGLLGLALSPNYATDKLLFAYHSTGSDNRVVRMKFENDSLGTPEVILKGIAKNRFHNGGRIIFGPDKLLYIGTGDAQNDTNAQNKSSLNGKILRITPDGKGAPGNPFGSSPVFSMGHRNVQGLWFDSKGRLWASEFGNSNKDELNLISAGKNYGWPECEGKCGKGGFVDPVHDWPVAQASPSGLCIVNDTIFMASLRGTRLWRMEIQGDDASDVKAYFVGTYGRLRTVLPAPDGSIWMSTSNHDNNGNAKPGDDKILRIALD